MNLTKYSRNRLLTTFSKWDVAKDFADPMYNYLVYGYSPGGFFTSVLANDFHSAVARSHPANTIEALKHLGGWILDFVPQEARGSYNNVEVWCSLPADVRRTILEDYDLIHTEQQEIMMALQSQPTTEPVLY